MAEHTTEEYTIEDLIKELMEDEDWQMPMPLRQAFVEGLAFTLFTA